MTAKASTPPDLPDAAASQVELDEHARIRERMELLSSASFEGLVFHVDGVVFDVNERLLEITGFEREELLGEQLLQRCVAAEDLPEVFRRTANRIEGEYVVTGIRKDGSRHPAELQSKQGTLGDRPIRIVAVRDVSQRERTQALLRESEARFGELASIAFDITVFSQDGDEPLVRVHLRHALESKGYEVAEAASGADALAAIQRGVPSAVVLDVTLPDLSGIELLRRMREQGLSVPIILSSGYHAAALDVERDSFQAFLAKPYTLSELFEAVARVLAN
jgi:PAS domain S-box-containing protein